MHVLCGRPAGTTDLRRLGIGCGWIHAVEDEARGSRDWAAGWSCGGGGSPRPVLLALLRGQVPGQEGPGISFT